MNIARLGVEIDPNPAVRAAAQINAALDSTGAHAEQAARVRERSAQLTARAAESETQAQQKTTQAVASSAAEQLRASTQSGAAADAQRQRVAALGATLQQTAAEQAQAAQATVRAAQTSGSAWEAQRARVAGLGATLQQSANQQVVAARTATQAQQTHAAATVTSSATVGSALTRAGAAVRAFFGVTGTAATTTAGAFSRVTGAVVGFMTQVLQFMPGATGMFAGLAGGASMAATSLAGVAAKGTVLMLILGPLVIALGGLVAAVTALGFAAVQGDKMVSMLARLNVITRDAGTAAAVYEDLYKAALQTGVAVDESAAAFVRFSVSTKALGATHRQVLDLVEGMQKAGTVAGSTAEEIQGAALQLSQGLSIGRLQGQDLKALTTAMPALIDKVSEAMGITTSRFAQWAEEGKLTVDKVFPAMIKAAQELGKEFDKMPLTMTRAIGILRVVVNRTLADIDRAMGTSAAFAQLVKSTAESMEKFRTLLQGVIAGGNWDYTWTYIFAKFDVAAAAASARFAANLGSTLGGILGDTWGAAVTKFKADIQTIRALVRLGGVGDGKSTEGLTPEPVFGPRTKDIRGKSLADVNVPQTTLLGGNTVGRVGYEQPIGPGLNSPEEVVALWERVMTATAEAVKTIGNATDALDKSSGHKTDVLAEQAYKAIESDAKLIEEYQLLRSQIQALQNAGRLGPGEQQRRLATAEDEIMGKLQSPTAAADKYPEMLNKERAYLAQRQLMNAETDRRIETNTNGVWNSFESGIKRTIQGWGTLDRQVQQFGAQVITKMADGVTQALTDIVTGTKSVGDAFRDMAVSILKDIANMIIKLLIQLAIQAALKALMDDPGAGARAGTAATTALSTIATATNAISGINTYSAPTAAPAAKPAAVEPALPTGGANSGGGGLDLNDMVTTGPIVEPARAQRHDIELSRSASRAPVHRSSADTYQVNLNIDATGLHRSGEDKEDSRAKAKKTERMGREMERLCRQVIVDEMRAGGSLSRAGR